MVDEFSVRDHPWFTRTAGDCPIVCDHLRVANLLAGLVEGGLVAVLEVHEETGALLARAEIEELSGPQRS